MRRDLGPVNRAVAAALGLVWLMVGLAALLFGLAHGHWFLVVLSPFAIWYAVVWFRVVARSRLLTWREFAAPWRRD